jgi:hypothetical protein
LDDFPVEMDGEVRDRVPSWLISTGESAPLAKIKKNRSETIAKEPSA